jgi:hypothetical protein
MGTWLACVSVHEGRQVTRRSRRTARLVGGVVRAALRTIREPAAGSTQLPTVAAPIAIPGTASAGLPSSTDTFCPADAAPARMSAEGDYLESQSSEIVATIDRLPKTHWDEAPARALRLSGTVGSVCWPAKNLPCSHAGPSSICNLPWFTPHGSPAATPSTSANNLVMAGPPVSCGCGSRGLGAVPDGTTIRIPRGQPPDPYNCPKACH